MQYHDMTPEYAQQHLSQELEKASKAVTSAASDLRELNAESLKEFRDYYDKILFYSAGSFSFTLALVNIVALQEINTALTKSSLLFFPNIYLLYFSWVCYILACVLVIASKKLHAYYLPSIGMSIYAEKTRKLREAEAAVLSHESAQIVSVTGDTNAVESLLENAEMIQGKEQENAVDADFYYKWKMRVATFAEVCSVVATIALAVAAIVITQTYIWG
jgi:hypothetical protein